MALSDLLDNFKTFMNKYHYTKSQSDGLITTHNNSNAAHSDIRNNLNNKISKSSTSGLVKNDGTIDTVSKAPLSHSHSAADVLDENALNYELVDQYTYDENDYATQESINEVHDNLISFCNDFINNIDQTEVLVTYTNGDTDTLILYTYIE